MKLTVAQIEVIPGEPQANKNSMIEAIDKAKSEESDIIVFPELLNKWSE